LIFKRDFKLEPKMLPEVDQVLKFVLINNLFVSYTRPGDSKFALQSSSQFGT